MALKQQQNKSKSGSLLSMLWSCHGPGKCPVRRGRGRGGMARCEIKLHTLWRKMRLHVAQPKETRATDRTDRRHSNGHSQRGSRRGSWRGRGRGSGRGGAGIRLGRMAKQRKKFDEIYLQLKCRQVQRARAHGQPKGLESPHNVCVCCTCVCRCVCVCLTYSPPSPSYSR